MIRMGASNGLNKTLSISASAHVTLPRVDDRSPCQEAAGGSESQRIEGRILG